MTRRWLAVLAVGALVALLAAPTRADAALCKKKNGAVFVRDACKRKETAVELPKGDPGAAGASAIRVHVLDATGKTVGHLDANGDVVIPGDGVAVHARASAEGFTRTGSPVYFGAADCVGSPFVFARSPLYQVLTVVGPNAYHAGAPVEPRSVLSVRSNSSPGSCMGAGSTYDAGSETCCSNFGLPVTQTAGPGIALDLGQFTPPFRVEVER